MSKPVDAWVKTFGEPTYSTQRLADGSSKVLKGFPNFRKGRVSISLNMETPDHLPKFIGLNGTPGMSFKAVAKAVGLKDVTCDGLNGSIVTIPGLPKGWSATWHTQEDDVPEPMAAIQLRKKP